VNCNVCMFLLWLPYGVINYNIIFSAAALLANYTAVVTALSACVCACLDVNQ